MLTLDRIGERLAFQDGWDLLIPFSMVQYKGEALSVTAIPRISRLVRSFLTRFENDPFSDEALAWLWSRIAPKQDEWGYHGGKYRWRRCRIFRCADRERLPSPLPETVLLKSMDGCVNQTTYRLEDTLRAGCLTAATCVDGRVLSVAVTHEDVDSLIPGDVIELGVETAPSARGRGYATSSLSLATDALLVRGLIPEYRSAKSNRASAAVALRAGYEEVGSAVYLLMRRDPDKYSQRKGAVRDGV